MVPKRNIVAYSVLLFLLSPPAFSKLFDLGRGDNGGAPPSASPVAEETSGPLIAQEDFATIVANKDPEVTGNVLDNDSNGDYAKLTSLPASEYGNIIFNADGNYTYTVHNSAPKVLALIAGQIVIDSFSYNYMDKLGGSVSSKLDITIIGNPVNGNGDTIFEQPEDTAFDNVDIEFNNRSAQATPVNPGHNIRGHLYNSSDKDWYKITSIGNEIIGLQMCPQGAACFGKKSWVMYVFDGALLDKTIARDRGGNPIFDEQGNFTYIDTLTKMEELNYPFYRWADETGSNADILGNVMFPTNQDFEIGLQFKNSSNHMYLAYEAGFFEGALIGIVDPCFDTNNIVEIGVPNYDFDANGQSGVGGENNTHDYFIAVSSPLLRDGGDCSDGSVVLERSGVSVLGQGADGKPKTYSTTEEYIVAFPYSDDQYTININRTEKNGISIPPLATADEQLAIFNGTRKSLMLPKIRILDQLYTASLEKLTEAVPNEYDALKFGIEAVDSLASDVLPDSYQATYDTENQLVMIPKVIDENTGQVYSAILKFHPASDGNPAWLGVEQVTPIQ